MEHKPLLGDQQLAIDALAYVNSAVNAAREEESTLKRY